MFFEHPEDRRDIFAEADVCIRMGKDDPEVLQKQIARYRGLGFDGRASTKDQPIPAGMAILRRHSDPSVETAMEMWWSEYLAGSQRDQISLPFALRETSVSFDLIKENVRENKWFIWRPHLKTQTLKRLSADYKRAGAVILHVPGVEMYLKRLLTNAVHGSDESPNWLWKKLSRQPRKKIHFSDNILGISPHGAPDIEIAGSEMLTDKPVALLCDDPAQHETHAISNAISKGIIFQKDEDVLASPTYGIARRLEFEESVKAFLQSHKGPKAILHAQDLERGNFQALGHWLVEQGRASWPVRLQALLQNKRAG